MSDAVYRKGSQLWLGILICEGAFKKKGDQFLARKSETLKSVNLCVYAILLDLPDDVGTPLELSCEPLV